jgi:hypothetical protein
LFRVSGAVPESWSITKCGLDGVPVGGVTVMALGLIVCAPAVVLSRRKRRRVFMA